MNSSLLSDSIKDTLSTNGSKFYDAILKDRNGDSHRVHKGLMAANSNFFKCLFTFGSNKSQTNYELSETSGGALNSIIIWVESGYLKLTEDNFENILLTSEFLDMTEISLLCQEWLTSQMTPYNCVGFWIFSKFNFLYILEVNVFCYITENFNDVYCEEEFDELHHDLLLEILTSFKIDCGEEKVWEGLVKWASKNQGDVTEMLLGAIRYGRMDTEYYKRLVRFHTILSDWPEADSLLSEGIFCRPRAPQSLLIGFGRRSPGGGLNSVSVYNHTNDMWQDLGTLLSGPGAYLSTEVRGEDVFLCGGHRGNSEWGIRDMFKFCLNTGEIVRMSSMTEARNYLTTAILGNDVYVMGGKHGGDNMKSVERYNIGRNQWFPVKSMSRPRSCAGSAALKGNIYVVGGFLGPTTTYKCEMYNPNTKQWCGIRPMSVARARVKPVAMDGQLVVAGGWDGEKRLRSCERYNPDTRSWSSLPDMLLPRCSHSLAVVAGRLVAVGGHSWWQEHETQHFVEVLDNATNCWVMAGGLSEARPGLSCVVVDYKGLGEDTKRFLMSEENTITASKKESEDMEID